MPNDTLHTDPSTESLDLFREVHKGIRRSLFELCSAAGALDPSDRVALEAFVARFAAIDRMLDLHHEHEDLGPLGELIGRLAPTYQHDLEIAHQAFVSHMTALREAVVGLGDGSTDPDELYDGIVAVVGAYLAHMLVEEHQVMPTLAATATFDELLAVQIGIRSTIPPHDMCIFMRSMVPAMNPDERTAMLGGMHANVPEEIFELFWATAGEVLTDAELGIVAARVGL